MGCDIHCYVEKKNADGVYECLNTVEVFGNRSYARFGYLANVRNYSAIKPICAPKGFPSDASVMVSKEFEEWGHDAHTPSWLSVAELLSVDYASIVEDRRVTVNGNGGCTCAPSLGKQMLLCEFLDTYFLIDIIKLANVGADRIVFWFDN